MDDKSLIQVAQVLKKFVAAHAPSPPGSPAPHGWPLPEEYSIELLNDAKAEVLRLSDQNAEVTQSFYELAVAIRGQHGAHKAAVHDMRMDHADATAEHKRQIAGSARNTFHQFCPILRRYLRGELSLEEARTDILAAIDPGLRDGEMANDLTGVLEEANAFRVRNEAFRDKASRVDAFSSSLKELLKAMSA
jgi:hypothetical protein